jgi:hypothetical protein
MVNYNNAKIYKLVNLDLGLTYYGSTCCGLIKRLSKHKWGARANTRKCTSSLLFEKGICTILLVELYPTDDKTILHQRERYWIENNECVNKVIPCRSDKEYYMDNRQQILKQKAIYRLENSDKINEQNRIYRANNKDKINEQRRIYRANNSDKIKERTQEWRVKNRDKIKAYNKAYRAKKKLEESLEPN